MRLMGDPFLVALAVLSVRVGGMSIDFDQGKIRLDLNTGLGPV